MFTKIAAAVIAASVLAAPALAGTTVVKASPSGTVKVIKHTGKHHVRHFHGKHAKIVKIVRPHKQHRAHVAHNTRVVVKTVKPSGRI